MAKKTGARLTLGLTCSVCKSRNYVTTRNKLNTKEKLNLLKFCNKCRKKTPHKEVEKLK
ncbi:50S ribosomal protein L33 [Patescibacteria group bacterium]|nr:50S ribosomal protein L33 [Patescibacteria group bacterium]